MAYKFMDMAMESSTSTGAGDITLDGAETGYLALPVAESPDYLYYCIKQDDGSQWEVGRGSITEGGTRTLSRGTVLINSSGGTTPINFAAGTKHVYNVSPATLANDTKMLVDGLAGTSYGGAMWATTSDATPETMTTLFAPAPAHAGGIAYWHISLHVSALGTSSSAVKSWTGVVTIVNNAVATNIKTVVDNPDSKTWDISFAKVEFGNEIEITVTGDAGETCKWMARATVNLAVEIGV